MNDKLARINHKVTIFFKKHSPTILSCIGACGVVATAVIAVKETPKAIRLLEKAEQEKGEDLSKLEVVKVAGPVYIPAIITGIATISCIFGANVLNKKQQASLVSAYILLDNRYREYQEKVKEMFGDEYELATRMTIANDHYHDDKVESSDKDDAILFFDQFSGRYFERTKDEVRTAEYHLNRNFTLRGYATLNELYDFLGLSHIDGGDDLGWSLSVGFDEYGYQWIDFHHELVELDDGMECYIISMPFEPTVDYLDY